MKKRYSEGDFLYSSINRPITIDKTFLQNRVVFQPMEGCDGEKDGSIGKLTRRRYMRFAASGAGLIWFEAVAVSAEARANPRQLFLTQENKMSFKNLVSDIKKVSREHFGFEPVIIMQATHSGRYSRPYDEPKPIIAYHNPLWEKGKEGLDYTVATTSYCEEIPSKYFNAAQLAYEVGFDGIDIKCCHGYLFNEFLSAYNREDNFGGSFENRTRLYFNCIDSVRNAVENKMIITTRLNGCDCFDYPYGFGVDKNNNIDLYETKKIITELARKGVKLINLTVGNPYVIPYINRPETNAPEDGNIGVKRIYDITKELQSSFPNIAFVLSGVSFLGENVMDYANKALEESCAKLVGFGRMIFSYPQFYQDYLKNGKLEKTKCCIKCGKCTQLMRNRSMTGCPIRDSDVYMPLYKKYVLKQES